MPWDSLAKQGINLLGRKIENVCHYPLIEKKTSQNLMEVIKKKENIVNDGNV